MTKSIWHLYPLEVTVDNWHYMIEEQVPDNPLDTTEDSALTYEPDMSEDINTVGQQDDLISRPARRRAAVHY